MFEKENRVRDIATSSKRNVYLVLLAVVCLVLSLVVFYPLSMKVDDYSIAVLTVFAYSFYLLQGASVVLTVLTFVNGLSLIKVKRDLLVYLVFFIDGVLFVVFCWEVYWFLNHL